MNPRDPEATKTVRESIRAWLQAKVSRPPIGGKKPKCLYPVPYGYGMRDYLNILVLLYGILKLPFIVVQSLIEELRARRTENQGNRDDNA